MAKIMPLASADLDVVPNGPATGMRLMCLALFPSFRFVCVMTCMLGRWDVRSPALPDPFPSARAGMRNVGDRPENEP